MTKQRKRLAETGLLLALSAAVAQASWTPVGLAALEDLDALPLLREGARPWQESSFDRTGDLQFANDDRNTWLRMDENEEFVLVERTGAGCVYRIWMTYSQNKFVEDNRIRVYFDGEATPRIDMNVGDFFSGTLAPFLYPLVANKSASAGGMICYIPLPYRDGIRITTTWFPPESDRPQHVRPMNWGYYNINGHSYDTAQGVTTWSGSEDYLRVMDQWTQVGEDPKGQPPTATVSGTVSVPSGGSAVLAAFAEPGVVVALLLEPEPRTTAVLEGVRLQISWDGADDPAVDAPLGEFFGSGFGEVEVASLMIGMTPAGAYYCYFPMPFWDSAVIRVVNDGTSDLDSLAFEIRVRPNDYDRLLTGSFMARHTARELPGDESDYPLLVEQGRGHLVGVSLSMQAGDAVAYGTGLMFLEVDERLFLDGARSPAMHGTGLEDYFNCGWYYQGVQRLNLPCHGIPVRRLISGQPYNYASTYRLHLGDVLPFESEARFLMEVVPRFMPSDSWRSVTYFYKLPGDESGLLLVAEIDPGDPQSEADYQYTVSGPAEPRTDTWRFPGRQPFETVTHAGRRLSGRVEFVVPLPPANAGVLLRRLIDAGIGGQAVRVFIDGDPVGRWIWTDESFAESEHRWVDTEFAVERGYTAGKTEIRVAIERDPEGAAEWTDYGWQVFSIVPLDSPEDTDRDGLPDTWEVRHFGRAGLYSGGDDPLDKGVTLIEEHVADTDPNDPDSFLRFTSVEAGGQRVFRFESSAARLYTLYRTGDLTQGDWDPVPGAGPRLGVGGADEMTVTDEPFSPVFYRLGVRLP